MTGFDSKGTQRVQEILDSSEAEGVFGTLPQDLPPAVMEGLRLLRKANTYALDVGSDRWEFAVEVQQFYHLNLSNNDLRWMIAKGLAEHRQELSTCQDEGRTFANHGCMTFSATSALVITELGRALVSRLDPLVQERAACESMDHGVHSALSMPSAETSAEIKPTWDAERRELRVRGELVKWFRVPAASQETVLAAFEEESWPPYIDDPLPTVKDSVPKQRLRNAIKRLNENQKNRLIRFHGNGEGEGIGWTLIEKIEYERSPAVTGAPRSKLPVSARSPWPAH